MAVVTDIRVLVPRVRRRLEGAGAPAVLSDDAVKDLVADALSSVTLYTGSVFGKTIDVSEREGGIPIEYTTSDELTLQEGTVVAAQAALDHFFWQFASLKTSEKIADEAGTWEYARSASLLKGQLELLIAERNRALDALMGSAGALDAYVSYLAVRDVETARLVEPWVADLGGNGGLGVDFRFLGAG